MLLHMLLHTEETFSPLLQHFKTVFSLLMLHDEPNLFKTRKLLHNQHIMQATKQKSYYLPSGCTDTKV